MRIYNKSELFEPRRRALEAWSDFLEEQVLPPAVALADRHLERIKKITEEARRRGEEITTDLGIPGPGQRGRKAKLRAVDWPAIVAMLDTHSHSQVCEHFAVSRATLNKFRQRMRNAPSGQVEDMTQD